MEREKLGKQALLSARQLGAPNANGLMPATRSIPGAKKQELTRDYYAQILLIDGQLGPLLVYRKQAA